MELFDSLKSLGFIPSDMKKPKRYYEFEAKMIDFCIENKHEQMVDFDTECIEGDNDYAYLCCKFIEAIPFDIDVQKIKSYFDYDNEIAGCSAMKDGRLLESSWQQPGDYITVDFINYIKDLCDNDQGSFFELDTGCQDYCTIFVPKDIYLALVEYKESSKLSREEFLTSDSNRAKHIFSKVKILPEDEAIGIISKMKEIFVHRNSSFFTLANYNFPDSVEAALIHRDDYFMVSCKLIRAQSNIQNILPMSEYNYEEIIPDEECYFYSIEQAKLNVVFEYHARSVPGRIAGERENSNIGSYLLAGKGFDWCIFYDESGMRKHAYSKLICSGNKVTEKVRQHLQSINENKTIISMHNFIDNELTDLLNSHGFSRTQALTPQFAKEFRNHTGTVALRVEKDKLDESIKALLISHISITKFESDDILRYERSVSNAKFWLVWDEKNAINIFEAASHAEFTRFTKEITDRLMHELPWLNRDYSLEELVDIFIRDNEYIGACGICTILLDDIQRGKDILKDAIANNPKDAQRLETNAQEQLGISLAE